MPGIPHNNLYLFQFSGRRLSYDVHILNITCLIYCQVSTLEHVEILVVRKLLFIWNSEKLMLYDYCQAFNRGNDVIHTINHWYDTYTKSHRFSKMYVCALLLFHWLALVNFFKIRLFACKLKWEHARLWNQGAFLFCFKGKWQIHQLLKC